MGVAIVTDSTAYLTPAQVAEAGAPVRVVPLHVVIGGTERREGVDVRVEDLAEALRALAEDVEQGSLESGEGYA